MDDKRKGIQKFALLNQKAFKFGRGLLKRIELTYMFGSGGTLVKFQSSCYQISAGPSSLVSVVVLFPLISIFALLCLVRNGDHETVRSTR